MGDCIITRRGGGSGPKGFPDFEYTGQMSPIIDDGKVNGKQNWRIKFLTSGTLTFNKEPGSLDAFLVGGGGGGGFYDGGGGGGGYTMTNVVQLKANTPYTIEVGAGGNGSASSSETGADGGATSIVDAATGEIVVSIGGGKGGDTRPSTSSYYPIGGDGGSGGGSGGTNSNPAGTGGSDGSDGLADGYKPENVGDGQGTTTREFGDADGQLYAGGGGGGAHKTLALGGEGGGGNGSCSNGGLMAEDGETNTGGGGGGGGDYGPSYRPGAAGGSGIIILRNHREVSA